MESIGFDPTKLAVDGEDAKLGSPADPNWAPATSNIPAAPWGKHFRDILRSGDMNSNWGYRNDHR